jgi:hypothetical protein
MLAEESSGSDGALENNARLRHGRSDDVRCLGPQYCDHSFGRHIAWKVARGGRAWMDNGGPLCIVFGGLHVDDAIEEALLGVVGPGAIAAATAAAKDRRVVRRRRLNDNDHHRSLQPLTTRAPSAGPAWRIATHCSRDCATPDVPRIDARQCQGADNDTIDNRGRSNRWICSGAVRRTAPSAHPHGRSCQRKHGRPSRA